MRWIWIDRFIRFEPGKMAQAIKNVSLSEEHLHDHFPGNPVMPAALIIEGMAQTAGILICQASGFKDKVVLAKIGKAVFEDLAVPGDSLLFTVKIERLTEQFAVASGVVSASSMSSDGQTVQSRHLAEMELMFSNLDHNQAGKKFPEGQFILTDIFETLLRDVLPAKGGQTTGKASE